jgi:hypothetical protein
MILAKEITRLVESTTQESVKEKLDRFVSLITPHALGLDINHVIVNNKATIYADLSIFNKKDAGKLSRSQIISNRNSVIKKITYNLGGPGGSSGAFTSLATVLGINKKPRISNSDSSISIYYPQTKSTLNITDAGQTANLSVRVELSFPENVLDLETLYTPRFVEIVGNSIFGKFLLVVSDYRTEQVFGDEFLSIKDKLVSGVNKGFGREVKSIGTNDTQPRLFLFYDFPVKKLTDKSSNQGVLTDFMTEVKPMIIYPLKELHKILRSIEDTTDGVFHFSSSNSMFYVSVILSDSESTGEAAAYTTDVGQPKPGNIRVFCALVKFEELEFIPETGLGDLIDAISFIFLNYKKLINNYNNRPTKKTNADW